MEYLRPPLYQIQSYEEVKQFYFEIEMEQRIKSFVKSNEKFIELKNLKKDNMFMF